MTQVREERTRWRDEALSARHRDWGWNCPAVDLDFLMVEYNHAVPVALVDYKAGPWDRSAKGGLQAIANLGDAAGIPAFVVRYWSNIWAFRAYPLNKLARNSLKGEHEDFTEFEWVSRLADLRGYSVEYDMREEVLRSLKHVRPPAEAAA